MSDTYENHNIRASEESAQRLTRLEVNYEGLVHNMNRLTEEVHSAIEEWRKSSRFPVKEMAAWASVLLTIIGLLGSILWISLARIEYNHGKLADQFRTHISDGHPTSVKDRVADNTKAISRMDAVLQREMRLLDEILQREMKLRDDALEGRMRVIERAAERENAANADILKQMLRDGYGGWITKSKPGS